MVNQAAKTLNIWLYLYMNHMLQMELRSAVVLGGLETENAGFQITIQISI